VDCDRHSQASELLDRPDRILRQLDLPLPAQHLQQHVDALARPQRREQANMISQRSLHDSHPHSGREPWRLEAFALSCANLGDDLLGHPRWLDAVEHQTADTRRPAGLMPLKFYLDEGVARK
jgi:hypothetical protein